METTSTDAPESLPADLDFDAIVAEALRDPEIVRGIGDTNVVAEDLAADVSRDQALEGVRSELAALEAVQLRLTETAAVQRPDRPIRWLSRRVPDAAKRAWAEFVEALPEFVRNLGRRAWRAVVPSSGLDTSELDLLALEAEHEAAVQRLETALAEQIRRQLRPAVERHVADSFSTLLTVDQAPGLAQLVDDDFGVDTQGLDDLSKLFGRMPGGSVGLAGRRGIGKSKLIQRMCSPAPAGQTPQILATVVSAPTKYDSREFILHLFTRLCETVVGGRAKRAQWVSEREAPATRLLPLGRGLVLLERGGLPLACAGVILVAVAEYDLQVNVVMLGAGLALVFAGALVPKPRLRSLVLVGAGAAFTAGSLALSIDDPLLEIGCVVVALGIVLQLVRDPTRFADWADPAAGSGSVFPPKLVTSAHALLDQIEYQRTIASGWTATATAKIGAGPAELGGGMGLSTTQTMAQVPLSFPEIVERLRQFLQQAATARSPTPASDSSPSSSFALPVPLEVRIGIDELDKIESDDAHRFLNEIKAVFGIPSCYFLVSVSEEAMSNFDRRGAHLRDVFDSSFDEIVYVPPLTFAESMELLRQRVIGLPVPYLALCHVLSAGLPRDLIRVARALIAAKPAGAPGEMTAISTALIELELKQRARAVSVVAGGLRLEPQTSSFLRWARELPTGVSVDALLAHCERLEPFGGVDPDVARNESPERASQMQLADLTVELVTFCYFAATLIAFFDGITVTAAEVKAASSKPGWVAVEDLTAARAATSANPRLAWGLVTAFRATQPSMRPLQLPERRAPVKPPDPAPG